MITNEEARKAIEKYQEKHPLPFGTMMDVTATSSKEGADLISQTIERVSKKMEEDTELWCICEMAKMYMQGVRPVYPVRPKCDCENCDFRKFSETVVDGFVAVMNKHGIASIEQLSEILECGAGMRKEE